MWRNKGSRKSALEYQSNKCYRQHLRVNSKISGQTFKEKQDIFGVSKYLPQNTYYRSAFNKCLKIP